MKDRYKYALAILLMVAIFAIPFIVNPTAKFGGSDDAGAKAVLQTNPNYQPWVQPLWKPPPETESMLFALQAALGALIIGYFIGHERARQEFLKKMPKDGRGD